MNIIKFWLIAIFAAVVMAGCGSSGGGGGGVVAGIDRLGASAGTVTGFGSIFVNGVEFETDGTTQFTIDDSPGVESDLSIGDVVIVVGSIDANGTTGSADTVFADEAVEGPVDSIDLVAGTLVVAGQLVITDASTSFDNSISPTALDGLAAGNFVEVSGFPDADNNIRATRIERKAVAGIPPGEEVEVHGFVANLAATTFRINGLTVDFSTATIDNFPGGAITAGDFVEAKGVSFGAGGELIATKVELEAANGGIDLADIDDLEIEGFITRFASATDFDVSGLPVTTNAQTVFEFEDDTPASAADLGLNVKVEVEGDVNASGVLVADKVEVKRAAIVRITADVDSVDAPNNTFVVLGVTVRVDSLTRIEDKSDVDDENFMLSELMATDYVEMRGTVDVNGSGDVLAERVEREDPDPETIIQGFVESVSQPMLSILGVTIETNGQTVFRDANDNVIGNPNDFFAAIDEGSVVKAKGMETSATVVLAEEVEIEGEN